MKKIDVRVTKLWVVKKLGFLFGEEKNTFGLK